MYLNWRCINAKSVSPCSGKERKTCVRGLLGQSLAPGCAGVGTGEGSAGWEKNVATKWEKTDERWAISTRPCALVRFVERSYTFMPAPIEKERPSTLRPCPGQPRSTPHLLKPAFAYIHIHTHNLCIHTIPFKFTYTDKKVQYIHTIYMQPSSLYV